MLLKSKSFGFSVRWCAWLESYLSNRIQRGLYRNKLSKETKVASCAPQGSLLGPHLFLIFINDLPSAIQHSQILLFADDNKIFYSYAKGDLSKSVNFCLQLPNKIAKILNLSLCKAF